MLGVVAVNGVLITAAVTTFAGVTAGRAFERGRACNHVLAEAARQGARGWRADLALADGVLSIAGRDREGRPVAGALAGTLLRPLEGTELPLDLAEVAPGRWIAPVATRPGEETRLALTGPGSQRFDIPRRIVAP